MPFVFLDLYAIIRRCLHAPFEFGAAKDLHQLWVSGGPMVYSAGKLAFD